MSAAEPQPVPGEQRPFARFADAVDELIDARVWAGLHFRNADEHGAQLGREVARYVHVQYFATLR